jgi:16S rRNA (uracil1498-N3)-methyltransferase
MVEEPDSAAAARLHVSAPLAFGGAVPLDGAQAHYLRDVLRLRPGGQVALFNGIDGEWLSVIEELARSGGRLRPERQTRPQPAEPDLWLCFAPIKRGRIDYLAEKATELGASALCPVFTRRTIVTRVNTERLAAHAREAAEQTERLSVPSVAEPVPLDRLLRDFPAGRRLILCDESGTAPPIGEVLRALRGVPGGWAVMTGPEGGFAPEELDALTKLPFVTSVGLGPRILRADTAALAALAVFQSVLGDWGSAGHAASSSPR